MSKNANVLKFNTPSQWWGELWREGLYLGNGKLGANVYGGARDEKLLLSDATLTWQGHTTVVPDVSDSIEETKKRIEEGDFLGAQNVMPTALLQKNFRPVTDCPLPICQLNLTFLQSDGTRDFTRTLDMENGEATVTYSVADTRYKRSAFVSRVDNLVAYRVTKQGAGSISLKLSLSLLDGTAAYLPESVEVKYDRQFTTFAARNPDNGADFGAVVKLQVLGGSIRPEDDHVEIVRAQSVLLLVKTFVNGMRDRDVNALKQQLPLIKDGYEMLFKSHAAVHSKLFDSADVKLDKASNGSIEQMLLEVQSGEMPAELAEKIYKFGRYLTVAMTPSDGAPQLTPVGLWNGSYKPSRCYRSASGELQMSFAHMLQGNMLNGFERSFEYFWNNLDDYRNNAQRIFGCRGIVVPVVAAPNTGRLGSTDVYAVHFSGCAAFVANLYYKYAKISQNTKFLKNRLIPFMKEIALFYGDKFRRTSNGLEICPSALPMRLGEHSSLTDRPVLAKNSALDFDLARDLLTNLLEACNSCNVKGNTEAWQKLLNNMPAKQITSDGAFKEFINSIISVDYTGVSNGTLYPAYFGEEVNFLSEPETVQQYVATADKKRSDAAAQNSYNMTVLAAVYARLANGNDANACLTNAVRGCIMNNLAFVDKDWRDMGVCGGDSDAPVQLNVNMAFTHVVQQMLMYSKGEIVRLFPALPDGWRNVSFSQFLAENNVIVSASLDCDRGVLAVKLESKKEACVHLYLPDYVKKLTKTNLVEKSDSSKLPQVLRDLCAAVKSVFNKDSVYAKLSNKDFELTLPAGKAVELQYKISR